VAKVTGPDRSIERSTGPTTTRSFPGAASTPITKPSAGRVLTALHAGEYGGNDNLMKILLDLDGVMADLTGGLMRVHNKPWPFGPENRGPDAWYLTNTWEMSADEMWEPCGFDFWAGLQKTLEADQLYQTLCRHFGQENICFLTSPVSTAGCVEGKREWCARHYPATPILFSASSTARFTPGGPKEFLAGPERYLIDDNQDNCKRFEGAGGRAFLWPAWWNDRFEQTHFRMHLLEQEIRHMKHFQEAAEALTVKP